MFTGVVLGLGIAALLYYVHKVGLPKVLLELQQTRIEMVAAINRHSQATKPLTPNRPNPLPVNTQGPDLEVQKQPGNNNLPQQG